MNDPNDKLELSNPLSLAQIDSKMAQQGFAEMRWLWKRFKAKHQPPADIDATALSQRRQAHMGMPSSAPTLTTVISLAVAILAYRYLHQTVLPLKPVIADHIMLMILSLLCIYLFWFLIAVVGLVRRHHVNAGLGAISNKT